MYVRAKKIQRFTCQDAIFNIFLYQSCLTIIQKTKKSDSQAIQSPPSYRFEFLLVAYYDPNTTVLKMLL